jgi:transposase
MAKKEFEKRSTVASREEFRERVKKLTPQMKKSEIVKHFAKEGIARQTVYDAINRLAINQPTQDKKRSGRPTTWTTPRKTKLKRLVNNRTGVSQPRLGKKFGVHQTTIGRQLAKMGIPYRKREKTAKYNPEQQQRAEELSGKLANNLYRTSCSVIIDDEKYFTFSGNNMPGNAGYYSSDKSNCPDKVRFAGKEKFPTKILVWIAISARGMSKPLIRPSKSEAIKSDIYISECLAKRLLPFIHEHHPDFNYIFWPDLASAHYSKATVAWMEQNVNYVAKKVNPPNVPQARPIENFWGWLTQKVYEGGWEATNEQQLIRRIELKLKEFDLKSVETLMAGVKAKLKSIADNGVFSYLKK